MTSRLSRFLHLERSRDGRAKEEPSQLQNGSRFETVGQPGEAPRTVVPEAHLERFRPGEAPLVLAGAPTEEAPFFPRCARCEAESGRFAPACGVCGADLSSPEQRAYNEQLLQARQQQAAREREALRASLQQQAEARRREANAQVDTLMEQLRRHERGGARWRTFSQGPSFGLGLVRLIPSPLARGAVLAGCVLLPLLLATQGRGLVRLAGVLLGVVVVVLFVPSSPGRAERWRW